jgi:hypothetical protein
MQKPDQKLQPGTRDDDLLSYVVKQIFCGVCGAVSTRNALHTIQLFASYYPCNATRRIG